MQGIGVLLCMPEHPSAAEVGPAELPKRWLQVGEGTCYAAWPVGSTPLHIAAAKGALQIIRAMLQAQVRPPAVRCHMERIAALPAAGTGAGARPCAARHGALQLSVRPWRGQWRAAQNM